MQDGADVLNYILHNGDEKDPGQDQIENIIQRLKIHNTGTQQIPGLIVMSLADDELQLDPNFDSIVVAFNADSDTQSILIPEFQDSDYVLHPLLDNSKDATV